MCRPKHVADVNKADFFEKIVKKQSGGEKMTNAASVDDKQKVDRNSWLIVLDKNCLEDL